MPKAGESLHLEVDTLPDMVQALLADERKRLNSLQEAAIEAQRKGLALQGKYVQRLFYLEAQAARLQAHAQQVENRERVNIEVSEELLRLMREIQRGVTDVASARATSQEDLDNMAKEFEAMVAQYKASGLADVPTPYVQAPDNAALATWLGQAGLQPKPQAGEAMDKALKYLHEANQKLQPGQQVEPAELRRINRRVAKAMGFLVGEDRPVLKGLDTDDEAQASSAARFNIATPRGEAAAASSSPK
jgi:hypothetical protein